MVMFGFTRNERSRAEVMMSAAAARQIPANVCNCAAMSRSTALRGTKGKHYAATVALKVRVEVVMPSLKVTVTVNTPVKPAAG